MGSVARLLTRLPARSRLHASLNIALMRTFVPRRDGILRGVAEADKFVTSVGEEACQPRADTRQDVTFLRDLVPDSDLIHMRGALCLFGAIYTADYRKWANCATYAQT